MFCLRCRSKMIHEKSFSLGRFLYEWHCLICGEIFDPIIVLNRLNQHANTPIRTRKRRRVLPLTEELLPLIREKNAGSSSL